MKFRNAQEIIGGLDAAQKTRFKGYYKSLSMDRDKVIFDDKVFELVSEYRRMDFNIQASLDHLNKLGYTRARYEYSQIVDQLRRFQDDNHPKFSWNKHFQAAKANFIKEVQRWYLLPTQYYRNEDCVKVIPKKDAHAGFSYILTGKRHKEDYFEDVYEQYTVTEMKARKQGSFNCPILIGDRTQASNPFKPSDEDVQAGRHFGLSHFKSKSRLVSMMDIFQILAEAKWAKPFQVRMSSTDWYAGGSNDRDICRRMTNMRGSFPYSITIDYSKYDQSISDWLIRECFDVVRAAFCGNDFDEELFSVVREDFIHKVFVDGEGNLVESHKGVPSGSMFTQIVDSIANRLMVETYLRAKSFIRWDMMVMGDDNIIFTHDKIDPDDIASYLAKNFGVEVNSSKMTTAVSAKEYPHFLSREWRFGGAYREPHELFSMILYPERFREYEKWDLDPAQIVHAYILTFPLGMRELIDVQRFESDFLFRLRSVRRENNKWMTGLMRYRQLYMKDHQFYNHLNLAG